MRRYLVPLISTALLALPLAAFAADQKPASLNPKPPAKEMVKSNTAQSKSAMAGKSDGGDKPKPEKPPKKVAMNSQAAKTGMAGKSDGGDKPKPEKPPKSRAVREATTMTR